MTLFLDRAFGSTPIHFTPHRLHGTLFFDDWDIPISTNKLRLLIKPVRAFPQSRFCLSVFVYMPMCHQACACVSLVPIQSVCLYAYVSWGSLCLSVRLSVYLCRYVPLGFQD